MATTRGASGIDKRARVLNQLRHQILTALSDGHGGTAFLGEPLDEARRDPWRKDFEQSVRGFLRENGVQLKSEDAFVEDLAARVELSGPIADLLVDETVSEVMVVGPEKVYVEREGKIERTDRRFRNEDELRGVIQRVAAALGRRVDDGAPMVDARLPDGSRVNGVLQPISVDGSMLTIRKFSLDIRSVESFVERGSASPNMMKLLEIAVRGRLNAVVVGGTGTGKTTLLNLLASFIPAEERIITIEDTAELRLAQEHVGRLEARHPDTRGEGRVTIAELFRNSLRMRPDRILVGECRGEEAFFMLQAMNTGHDGSLTTLHANSPRDALDRIENMVLMAGYALPANVVRKQVASAIDLLVQVRRYADGSRKIESITEVTGTQGETVSLAEIFKFEEQGRGKDGKVAGRFVSSGFVPKFYEELRGRGQNPPMNIFQ
ncbi:MAG: CpaF family protein [Planctomycetes bacterium]|nr:CpaF family protein [Planctomycetota bacterium]